MSHCPELSFDQVARDTFESVAARAQSAGLPISGDAGEGEAGGFRVRWAFNEAAGTLWIQCIASPMLVPCAAINGKISSIVQACRPSAR